jgi:Ca2+-transporting ATPase
MQFYKLEKKEVFKFLQSNEDGLTSEEASSRLKKYGLNELKKKRENKILRILIEQVNSFVVYILIAAMLISFFVNQVLDGIVIGAIIVLNTVLGFFQEYKADKAIQALKKLETSQSVVIRDNKHIQISSKNLVPGDIILLDQGDKIPADCYLLEAFDLKVDESILTGESISVKKFLGIISHDVQVSDQSNMLFSSTTVVNGRTKAVVVKTAMETEVGKIATIIQEESEKQTPLQKKLDSLGKILGYAVIVIALIVLFTGLLEDEQLTSMLLIAISLAVAAVPEGLPAVVTISLALGVQRMVKKNTLVRRLSSVETLGSTTIISADKTGTITQNKMTVTKMFVDNKILEINENSKNKELLIEIFCNANDSKLPNIGDPTELALLRMKPDAKIYPKIDEIPFTSERKYMISYHKINNKIMTYSKFAPEKIIELCSYINVNGKITKFTKEKKATILKINEGLAKNALRLLGCAYGEGKKTKDLIFVGLVGMIDPPRPEVTESLDLCRKAGIKVVMITGDHKLTAQAIARQIGLDDRAVTGDELDQMSEEELENLSSDISIYARVNPEHKVRILNALKKKNNIVAMTGDGINDAPALKKSDIGVAVGSGTDVAKEASDMILLDNNFHSIVRAVEEGRGIYDNIKRFVNYLLSCNFSEVLIIFIGILLGFRDKFGSIVLPLGALELLWINLVTDGLPALALGIDLPSKSIMFRKPRKVKDHIISKTMTYDIIIISILMTIITLYLFSKYLPESLLKAQTIAFTVIVIMEMIRVIMIHLQYKLGLFSNKWLILAIISSVLLQLLVIYTPLSKVFDTVPLSLIEWSYILIGCVFMFIIGTIGNYIIKGFTKELD